MTTRPGYVWDNTALEWVTIGPVALPGSNVFYQASAPATPATGDIWIDSDDDVPSIDSSVFYRWKETAVGGETTLSGADDNGLALKYTPGYEELYINGVLQVRGSDYVATTGNTITGLTALVAGDIVTVMSQVAYTVGDTYTQTAADAKFVSKNVGGLNLVVPTSVTGGTVNANGAVTIGNAVSSVTVNGAFSATYDAYKIIVTGGTANVANPTYIVFGSTNTGYYSARPRVNLSTGAITANVTSNGSSMEFGYCETNGQAINAEITNPFLSTITRVNCGIWVATTGVIDTTTGYVNNSTSYTSFTISSASLWTGGTIRIYGYNNGA